MISAALVVCFQTTGELCLQCVSMHDVEVYSDVGVVYCDSMNVLQRVG